MFSFVGAWFLLLHFQICRCIVICPTRKTTFILLIEEIIINKKKWYIYINEFNYFPFSFAHVGFPSFGPNGRFYILFVFRWSVAWRSCSILKSSTVKFNLMMWCIMNSSDMYLGGGDRSTSSVSHKPLHDFRTFADPKLAPRITSATLKMTCFG